MTEINCIKQITVEKTEIKQFQFNTNECVHISVKGIDNVFDFIVRRANSNRCLILGAGAYDNKMLKPPIFQRLKWCDDFDCNLIYFNDPTLYNVNTKIGWGVGSDKSWYLEEMSKYLLDILENLDINNEKVLVYGSSGGGYMALVLAGMLKGCTTLVNNPQTNIVNYSKSIVEEIITNNFPGENFETVVKDNMRRISIIEHYKSQKYIPKIVYWQNIICKYDINMQVRPFINELANLTELDTNNIKFDFYFDYVNDHNPLGRDITVNYINQELSKL